MLESITREPGRASRDGGRNERPRRGPARRDDVGNQGENERHGASLKFIRSRDAGPPAGPPAGRGALPPGSQSSEDRGAASRWEDHAEGAETRDSFPCEMGRRQSPTGETGVGQGAPAEGAACAGLGTLGRTSPGDDWPSGKEGEGRRGRETGGGQGKVTPSGEPLQAERLRLGWLAAPRLYWGRGFSVGCGL